MMADTQPMLDHQWFETFVIQHRQPLVDLATRISNNPAEAEDVVQDTLTILWNQWQQNTPQNQPRNPQSYAYRAVKLNAIKRHTRKRPTASLDAAFQIPAVESAPAPDPLEIERAIASLPPAQQAIVRMRYYLGLSFTQISTSLSISKNTAASRCRYALAALRSNLTHRSNPKD